MATRRYWKGFATGALVGTAAGASALLFTNLWGRAGRSRIIRLEKSVQIGKPVAEVFDAWRNIEDLPRLSTSIKEISREGNHSHWRVAVNGRTFGWDAEVEQLIPNQSIGWKSIRGARHSGRISFAPLGSDTLVHVTMNYAPPFRFLRPLLAPMSGQIEGHIEEVLRDFKRAVESGESSQFGPRTYDGGTTTQPARGTGTFGLAQNQTSQAQHSRIGSSPPNPVEYTAPPDAKR